MGNILITIEVDKQQYEEIKINYEILRERFIDGSNTPSNRFNLLLEGTQRLFDVGLEEIESRCRKRHIIDSCKFIAYDLRVNKRMTFDSIGKLLKRSHCSVLHHVNDAKFLMKSDAGFKRDYFKLLKAIEVRQEELLP